MEHIVKKLNSDILSNWKFTYDGYYWVNPSYSFKLIKSDTDGTYMVFIEGAPIGTTPPPIGTNSDLLRLIEDNFADYLTHSLSDKNFISNQAQFEYIYTVVDEYFSFDKKLDIKLVPSNQGFQLVPNNEYSYTILGGVEVGFKVKYIDKSSNEVTGEIYCNPDCICTEYLIKYFDCKEIKSVSSLNKDGSLDPFFGIGIPKVVKNKKRNSI
jgi:hypothetical protein